MCIRDRLDRKMGQRGAHTCDVIFEDYRVPAANLIGGREGAGFATAMKVLDKGRLHIAAVCVAAAERMLADALTYALERRQFGEPIAHFQLVQAMLAEMKIRIEATSLLVRKAAWNLDRGIRDPMTSACAKAYGADAAMQSAIDAVQVFGGNGYVKEYPVEKLMRDAKVLQIYEGTAQIQRLVIAKHVLG